MADQDEFGEDELLDAVDRYDWPVAVYAGYALAFVAAILGCVMGASLSFMLNDPGKVWELGPFKISETLCWAAICFFGGFVLLWSTGFPVAGVQSPMLYHLKVFKTKTLPAWGEGRISTVGFQPFDLYLTVHKVQNMYNAQDVFGFASGNHNLRIFVEVKIGRKMGEGDELCVTKNTTKRTCINTGGVFEEIFHFNCKPTDDTMRIAVMDQDIFREYELGSCDINITQTILDRGFPQKRAFKLQGPGSEPRGYAQKANSQAGTVVVSFAPGRQFPSSAMSNIQSKHKFTVGSMTHQSRALLEETNSQTYGNFGTFLSQKAVS